MKLMQNSSKQLLLHKLDVQCIIVINTLQGK